MIKQVLFILAMFFGMSTLMAQSVKNRVYENQHLNWADTAKAQQVFCSIPLKPEWTESEAFEAALKFSKLNTKEFIKAYRKESKLGSFIEYAYAPQGIKAYAHFVKIFVDKSNHIKQVQYLMEGLNYSRLESFSNQVLNYPGLVQKSKENIWYFNGSKWFAASEYIYEGSILAFDEKRIYSSTGEFLQATPLAFHLQAIGPDSLVPAKVFLPDPLTSAGLDYGDTLNGFTYLDYNDADSSGANQQRKDVMIKARLVNDTFTIRDTNFYFAEIEGPVRMEPRSMFPEFNYTRNQEQFEFVNIIYHLRLVKHRIDSLGYSNLPGFQIMIDAHASNGADVSAFSSKTIPPSLLFGDGGVDDGEDADVAVHEFMHGLSYGAAPNTVNGLERSSMEEGQGDYFAMSYSRRMNPYNWQKTFNWDGNITWPGRRANWDGVLLDDFTTNKYSNGEIWASALAEIYDSLGADICDDLVLAGLSFQTSNMTMRSMALSLIQADALLYSGVHEADMRTAFNRRRILYPLGYERVEAQRQWTLVNSYGFATGGELEVYFAGEDLSGELEIYDLKGALISKSEFGLASSIKLSAQGIKKGLYVLRITPTDQISKSIRLVRY